MDSLSGYNLRCELLSDLVTGPASGAEPSPLQVVANGTSLAGWRGLVIAVQDTGAIAFSVEPNFLLIAYSDANATNIIVGQAVSGLETTPYLVLQDTILVESGSGGAPAVGTASLGTPCTDTPGLANPLNTGPIAYSGSMCRVATFPLTMTANFPVSGADSGFTSLQIPLQNVSGILVSNPPSGSYYLRAR